jgi:hypothetical protein
MTIFRGPRNTKHSKVKNYLTRKNKNNKNNNRSKTNKKVIVNANNHTIYENNNGSIVHQPKKGKAKNYFGYNINYIF